MRGFGLVAAGDLFPELLVVVLELLELLELFVEV